MKHTLKEICLVAVLSGLTCAMHAQPTNVIVFSLDFDSLPLGSGYGTPYVFGDAFQAPTNIMIAPGSTNEGNFADPQAMQFTCNISNGVTENCGVDLPYLALSNNASINLNDYVLDFDMAVVGSDLTGCFVAVNIFGPASGPGYGQGVSENIYGPPAAGSGYQHFTVNLGSLGPTYGGVLLDPTVSQIKVELSVLGFPAGVTVSNEALLLDNVTITETNVTTKLPSLNVIQAKPGLRMFAANAQQVYNAEGMLTRDSNQSWVGSTPTKPASYSFTFQDFNTVPGFQFAETFVPNITMQGQASSPYTIYFCTNALYVTLTKQAQGFTASVDLKLNNPAGGANNNLTTLTTTNSGIGTWSLVFTNDTDLTLTAPDGTATSYSMPAGIADLFTNPCTVFYGIQPWSVPGEGQYIDFSSIAITNVAGINEVDDFTSDAGFNTNFWDTGYSVDSGSILQVSTSTPLWVTWTLPDGALGNGLGTKASLTDTSVPWHKPSFWNGVTPAVRAMGPSLKWALIPTACLPTVDGTTNGPLSSAAFFRLSNPAPSQ